MRVARRRGAAECGQANSYGLGAPADAVLLMLAAGSRARASAAYDKLEACAVWDDVCSALMKRVGVDSPGGR